MKYNKELLEQVKMGQATEEMLVQNIMTVNPLHDIIRFVVETLKKEPTTTTPITVSQEEYERIISLFRVRGIKMVGGELKVERRGRPSKSGLKED